ncbi:MAG: PAS domain-containing protein [Rhodospirillales bacterium]|nr:PAS domain-containing protein [Rhodospirillales bacterium]
MIENKERVRFQVVDMADNPTPAFTEVIAYWNEKRGDAFAPSWSDIHLMDLPTKLLPNCIVVDLEDASGPIRYRYYGTAIAGLHGFDLSQRTIQDMKPPDFRDQVIKQYRLVQEMRKPMFFIAHFPFLIGRRTHQYLLRLPLSEDGKTVTNVFSIQDISDHSQVLSKYYTKMYKDNE